MGSDSLEINAVFFICPIPSHNPPSTSKQRKAKNIYKFTIMKVNREIIVMPENKIFSCIKIFLKHSVHYTSYCHHTGFDHEVVPLTWTVQQ